MGFSRPSPAATRSTLKASRRVPPSSTAFLLNAKAAAEQKSYPIVITVEYEYGKGKSYSGTEEDQHLYVDSADSP